MLRIQRYKCNNSQEEGGGVGEKVDPHVIRELFGYFPTTF